MRKLMLVLGMAAVVGCGGISKEKYGAKEAEAAKYQKSLQDESGKVAALETQVGELQTKVQSLEQEKASMQSAAKDAQLLKLSEPVLFKENSSKLAPESKRALDAMADAIGQVKGKTVIVVGHTDTSEGGGKGAKAKRWQLSTARAMEVAKYLVGRGVDPALIGIAAFGEARPVAANDTMANRALNRRAEIALAPSSLEAGTVDVSRATVGTK